MRACTATTAIPATSASAPRPVPKPARPSSSPSASTPSPKLPSDGQSKIENPKSKIPGAYQLTDEERRKLSAAFARDLAPLREAAGPLLAALEKGELGVVGELEAFIAHLDALAPRMIGAGELADALEAALAQASIAGAAGAYAKLPAAQPPSAS